MKNHQDPARFLPLLLILFAGSGFSALVYEIVWYQLLQLAIGSTAVSLGILLATFMGGLCLGSIGLPRLGSARQHPLRTYAFLEAGIAIFGLLALFEMPLINRVYIAGAEHGLPGMLLRGLVAAVCMLPPTILMGASLPAIVRWIESSPRGVSWWGLLYSGNTAGAVSGCLVAGFYLLRIYDTAIATYAAVAVNAIVAAVSFALASKTPERSGAEHVDEPAVESTDDNSQPSRWPVHVTIALSGACALGAEVVWTRLMGMLLGNTVYVFSIILAVFLVGLAVGSGAASLLLQRLRPRLALGWCQILLGIGIAWTAYTIADSLPYWPIDPLQSRSPWHMFQLDLVRCLWAILPPTILWGASMPLACAAVAARGENSGRTVGGVYAANTFGAIIGALAVSLVLVPWIGTQNSQRLLLMVSALSALFVLVPHARSSHSMATTAWLAVSLIAAALLAWRVDPVPGALIAYGRQIITLTPISEIIFTAEGRNSSIAIGRYNDGALEIDVNGHVEASNEPFDMKLQRLVGHLPGMLHPNPKSVLGIGFGAGVSAGTFTRYPTIEKITICEIEPRIPPISTRYFAKENYGVFRNPRTHIVYDDARHYLLTTTEKFDIIASDPLDVFVKGTAALYSKEYFEAVKQHLNPGGMFTLYVPLYESDLRTVQSELATFFEAFPYATVWANTRDGQGYDMVFLGQAEPLKIDLDQIEQRLKGPGYAPVAASLRETGIFSAINLLSVYTGQKTDLGRWVQGAEINRDRDLRLQYLAGWGINSRMQDAIYRQMLTYRDLSITPFTGSGPSVQSLRAAIASASGAQ
ncbi:MAG TPA: fused MFS/spermidine synthase [Bryobacteraceae bacterium]|nr:fused MFS/spermidine synthase [Bryobacteraceae bacterium]